MLKDWDDELSDSAAKVLTKIGAPAVKALIEVLSDDSEDGEYARMYAVDALVEIGASAVEPLIAALRHQNKNIRRSVARILGDIGDIRAIEPLTSACCDQDNDTCYSAEEALLKIKEKSKVTDLIVENTDSSACIICGKKLQEPSGLVAMTGSGLVDVVTNSAYSCMSCGISYCIDCMTKLRKNVGNGICPKCNGEIGW